MNEISIYTVYYSIENESYAVGSSLRHGCRLIIGHTVFDVKMTDVYDRRDRTYVLLYAFTVHAGLVVKRVEYAGTAAQRYRLDAVDPTVTTLLVDTVHQHAVAFSYVVDVYM